MKKGDVLFCALHSLARLLLTASTYGRLFEFIKYNNDNVNYSRKCYQSPLITN